MSGPIFIFSSNWRSGSTLLQRLVNASNEVLIWGESGGALDSFQDAFVRYQQMLGDGDTLYTHGYGGNGSRQFEEFSKGETGTHNKWIACMNPPLEHIQAQIRNLMDRIYRIPAEELGYSRWGIKEVRSGIETAKFLKQLYPDAKFLFLVRNPMSSILSIKKRKWLDERGHPNPLLFYANHWAKLSKEFRNADFGMLLKFEEMVSDPELVRRLGDYLDLDALPEDFISNSHADWPTKNEEGLSMLEKLKLRYLLREEMDHYGYR
jgi:hypothetical protein